MSMIFSKHIQDNSIISKVRAVWQSLPEQLAKENKKSLSPLKHSLGQD